ncbi:MAG TPA: flagellar protein FlaG [Clostridiaceae bacterium]|nr:flagellar protein FlaG [Clostridiaceae bacterium]
MRVDSTDAISVATLKSIDTSISACDTIGGGTNAKSTINKSPSQMTEYEKRELPISERAVIDAIERANRAISIANRKFEFSIHEKTKQIMVKVINTDTNEVIREIPPEKILDIVASLMELAGLIVDERR